VTSFTDSIAVPVDPAQKEKRGVAVAVDSFIERNESQLYQEKRLIDPFAISPGLLTAYSDASPRCRSQSQSGRSECCPHSFAESGRIRQ
jgi:hypothetical protein